MYYEGRNVSNSGQNTKSHCWSNSLHSEGCPWIGTVAIFISQTTKADFEKRGNTGFSLLVFLLRILSRGKGDSTRT